MHWFNLILFLFVFSCTPQTEKGGNNSIEFQETGLADVISVEVSGNSMDYTFSVEIKSPDTGCDQYADWWEVITSKGELIYRRILMHSHVNEQPFIRTGGPVIISENTVVFVRAHMNNKGYGGHALTGSVSSGFIITPLSGFDELADQDPLPEACNF